MSSGNAGGSAQGHGDGSRKAILAALLANLGIAVAKFVGFLITHSSSLLAEAGHSLADTTNQGLLLLGRRQAARTEDEHHNFGHGMARYFWSFIVGLILFTLGSLFAIFEGIEKIRRPRHIEKPGVAIVMLAVAVLLEGFSFRTAIRESRLLKGTESWAAFIRTAKVPELPVLLLEDAGALAGLAIALSGIVLSVVTGNPRFDGLATLSIGFLLGIIAVVLIVKMRSLLLGESASPEEQERLRGALAGSPGVKRVINVRTMHLGPEELLVGAKLEFDASMSLAELANAIDVAEEQLRSAVPAARVVYLEPAVFDASRAAWIGDPTGGPLPGR